MAKNQKSKSKTSVVKTHKPSKKEIIGMIDKGVFDKFMLKDIEKDTGIEGMCALL